MKKLTLLLLIFASINLSGQIIYESVQRTNIYDFLDELANEKLISTNSVVKPYSRTFIAEKLQEAYDQKDQLSKRQIDEIEFYMKDYRLELVYNTKGMKPLNIFHKKDHIATSLSIDEEDFQGVPFNQKGGLSKAYELFGDELETIIEELNEVLAA